MSVATTSSKGRIGEFFRSRLDSSAISFFHNNADNDSQPPYGVITVTKLEETTPFSNVFTAEIKIAVVSDIDATTTEQHDALLKQVMETLNEIPRRAADEVTGIRLFGWAILYSETITKEESQSFSDVITIRAGCGG